MNKEVALTDTGNAVAADSLGNLHVAGSTSSSGASGEDAVLLKYSASGWLQGERTWGSPVDNIACRILAEPNGSISVGGSNSYRAGCFDVLLLMFDSSGNHQATRLAKEALAWV